MTTIGCIPFFQINPSISISTWIRCGQLGPKQRFSASNFTCSQDLEVGVNSDASVILIVGSCPLLFSPPESALDENQFFALNLSILLLHFSIFETSLAHRKGKNKLLGCL